MGLSGTRAVVERGTAKRGLQIAVREAAAASLWYLKRDERVAAAYEAELSRTFDIASATRLLAAILSAVQRSLPT